MTKEEFIEQVAEMVANAVMKAQGFGDWMPEPEPDEIARDIASLLPDYVFSGEA